MSIGDFFPKGGGGVSGPAGGDLGGTFPNPTVTDDSHAHTLASLPTNLATGPASATDNAIPRYDGPTGKLLQTGLATEDDFGTFIVNGMLVYPAANPSDDEKLQIAASFLLASDVHIKAYNNVDISSGSVDVGLKRRAAGVWEITNGAAGDGVMEIGGATCRGATSSAAGATTTELPNDKDWSFHKNTGTGAVHLAYNDGGVIKAVQLS